MRRRAVALANALIRELDRASSTGGKTDRLKRKARKRWTASLSETKRFVFISRDLTTSPDDSGDVWESSIVHPAHPAEPGAVDKSAGAIAAMFPELGELSDEDVDRAITELRKRY